MIIGSRWRYEGPWHVALKGTIVEIRAVHRGCDPDSVRILVSDDEIGELSPSDILEIAPLIIEAMGERLSFVTSDALPSHLAPLEKNPKP